MKKLLLILVGTLFLTACADLDKEKQIKLIQRQELRLDQLTTKIADKRLAEVSTFKVNTMQAELKIKQNLYLDTINMELAKQLDAFKIMRRSIKSVIKQHQKIKKGIAEEHKILDMLRQDIEQGRGERQRYDEFIQYEQNKVAQLDALTTDFLKAKNKLYSDYYRLYPPVKAFAEKLLAKAARRR
ncbi:MAG: hypothetical protein RLZZ65_1943 [Bacteroidota bacterium]|jgi:hypothetical protein